MQKVGASEAIDLVGRLYERVGQSLDDRRLLEQAKREVAERYGLEPNEAREMIYALARSQRRDLNEFCEEVVVSGGRFDGICQPAPLRLQT